MRNKVNVLGAVACIELKRGGYCLVDSVMLPFLEIGHLSWYMNPRGYILGGQKLMHRVIMDTPKGLVVDHLNHVKWDNRKVNLKNCTNSENSSNKFTTQQLIDWGVKPKPKKIESNYENFLKKKHVLDMLDNYSEHVKFKTDESLKVYRIGKQTKRYKESEVIEWLEKIRI